MLRFLASTSASQPRQLSLEEIRALKTELTRSSISALTLEPSDPEGTVTSCPILVDLFRPILKCYQSTENQFHLKVALCDVLATWLTKACRACTDSPTVIPTLRLEINDGDFQSLYDAMLIDWDLGGPIHAPLKEVFIKTLTIQKHIVSNHASNQRDLLTAALKMDHMQKSLYYAIEILRKFLGTAAILQSSPDFFAQRILNMNETTIATPLGRLLSNVMLESLQPRSTSAEQIRWLRSWQPSVVKCLMSKDTTLAHNLLIYLMPTLFAASKIAFDHFIRDLIVESITEYNHLAIDKLRIVIECLCKAKQVQIIGDLDASLLQQLHLPATFLKDIMSHSEAAIRVLGLQLLVSHTKLTTVYLHGTYQLLTDSLPYFFHETDMQLRKETLSGFRAFFMRYQASIYSCMMIQKKLKPEEEERRLEMVAYLQDSHQFAMKFSSVLKSNLEPGNGFQVTYTSLQLLQLASTFGWSPGTAVLCDKYASFGKPKRSAQEKQLPFTTALFDIETVRLLLDLLGDSFDDNRTMALALLSTLSDSLPDFHKAADVSTGVQNADRLLKSTRGRDGDGGARVLQFLFERFVLDEGSDTATVMTDALGARITAYHFINNIMDSVDSDIRLASNDMLNVAHHSPLHGRLIAIRYMVECLVREKQALQESRDLWRHLFSHIIRSCEAIWAAIKVVLTDDSPEGNLPSSISAEEDAALRGPSAQVILSFCWRALREASNLLRSVIVNASHEGGQSLIDDSDYCLAGELSLSWLTEVRHRGAFSAVFPNFVEISKHLLAMQDRTNLSLLPLGWLDRSIKELSKASHSKDITRRSGGLPMSIISLMIADSECATGSHIMVDNAMQQLIQLVTTPIGMSSDTTELPQVHGLNTLKDIFLESKLAASSIDYVERCFIISVDGFSSQIWAIRNCSLMLFSALIRRSFGSRNSRADSTTTTYSADAFFTRYPLLLIRLTEELRSAVDGLFSTSGLVVTTGLHPCLCLLARLDLVDTSELEDYSSYEDLLSLVARIATSPVWQIRSMAAQAIPTLVERELVGSFIIQQLNQTTTSDQNALHGRLLMIYHLLQYNLDQHTGDLVFVEQIISDVRRAITNKFVELSSENPCATTAALWLRILMFLARTIHSEQNASLRQRVVDYCSRELSRSGNKRLSGVGTTERNKIMTSITLRALADPKFKKFQSLSVSDALKNLIEDDRVEVRLRTYALLHKTFESSSILSSSNLQDALQSQSLKESWPIAKNAVRLCISSLPGRISAIEPVTLGKLLSSYSKELSTIQEGNPSSDITLILLGQLLKNVTDNESIANFYNLLRKFIRDNESADTRTAALNALQLSGLTNISNYTNQDDRATRHIELLSILLSLLSDDDEDLRHKTASLTCKDVLVCPPVTPEATREAVIVSCAQKYPSSAALQMILVEQITENEDPLQAMLAASNPSHQLFAVEKQNLWRNSVSNCRQALAGLSHTTVTGKTTEALTKWCEIALKAILFFVKEKGNDGPLGWTSIPETWQIIRRTLLVKDWLLARQSVTTDSISHIKNFLDELKRESVGKAIHPTLIKELTY